VTMDKIIIEHLSLRYSDGAESIKDLSLNIRANAITALIGPAGGGKSTFLRVLNRLNDLADVASVSGKVLLNGMDILDPHLNVTELRRKVGMVFARPLPLPLTIYGNVAYGLEIAGERRKATLDDAVHQALVQAQLWDEVNDRLQDPANALSGGQQQRVAIARAVVANPKLILADEPTGNLDSKNGIEVINLLTELNKEGTTIIMVTHSDRDAGYAHRIVNLFDGQVVTEKAK